jgi:hypothetical protein
MVIKDHVARVPSPAVKRAVYVLFCEGHSTVSIYNALRHHIEQRQVQRLVIDYRGGPAKPP